MKHCVKKLLSLAFALALCLAVGGIALAETPEQEVLAYEQNVTTAADVPNTTGNLERDGYTVTIPTTVEVKSESATGKLTVNAQLKQYRTLNIGIASNNKWKLAYDDATAADTPKVDYTLTTEDSEKGTAIAYYENNTLHYGTGELDSTDPKYDSTTGARKFTTNFSINVKDPGQATMSGTYSDTLTFTFDLVKHCVTYTINVYEQKLQLTNSGAHVQAVNVVDASGNVTDTTSVPKETYVLEYGCADANGTPLGNAVTTDTWMRPRTGHDVSEEEDTRCWEDLSRTLTPKADFEANNKTQTINLNLVRKQYWLDVNGATDYTGGDDDIHGNQGGRIGGFVNMQVSVDGNDWTPWFWQSDGDDYWGQFPYGIHFKLGFHHVKDGYVYDTGTGTLENGFRIIANKQDTVTDSGTKERGISGFYTTYYVYQDTLTGEPTDKTSKNVRYCYIPCYKKGITYFANGGTGGTEDYNEDNPPRSNVLYEETGTLKTPDALGITAPTGKSFAGWSTSANYPTTGKLYQPGDNVSTVNWENYTDQTDLNKRPQLNGKKDVEKRELYAIWKKPYTVKVQFGGDIGWTDWDDATQSFSKQGGDGFDNAVELGTAYAYGNTSLTLSATENKTVWNALQAMIAKKTSVIASGHAQQDDVWQLKDAYTFTTLPTNGEVTIQIKRKRYLLNVIPALDNGDGTYSPVSNATDAEQYGKFDLYSCGKPQTLEGKISYYQWMRNYGGSYRIYNVVPNTGYLFVGFERPTDKGPTTTDGTGNLTGKNTGIRYFGDSSGREYTGDTIYVMYKKDMVTFDFNGGTTGNGEMKRVLPYDDTVHFPKVVLTKQGVNFIGWSTKKDPAPGDEIFKLATDDPDHGVNPDVTTVSSKVKTWPDENNKVLYAVWSSTTGPNRAPAKKKVLTVHYHANFDPMEELALDLDPNPLLDDMDEDFGFDPDPLPEDILDPTVEAVKIVTYKPDENVVLRNCMFKRGGYVFVGWNTEPDGTGRNYEVNGVPITDWAAGATVDLYAQWKKPEHLKPVVDGEPQPGGATPAPTPQPGGADATPTPQLGGMDDAFGVDPQPGGMDDAFGIDPHLGGMDDAFGVDPQPGGMDDAFGV